MDAIILENVSKRFRKYILKSNYTTLKTYFVNLLLSRKQQSHNSNYIEAVKNISLVIPEGMTLGIIGRNGSGKSTLLKLLAGIYRPDSGKIRVNGRVSALIELGAGFHPEFTGRENIFINGIILGLTKKEIQRRFDEIVDFAELRDFIDAPVRTYSSGMYMRLGFSVAVNVDPDILLLDEVLAVGDEGFMKKCMAKMNEFKARRKTIVLVTHNLSMVESWCDEAVWIEGGEVRERGKPENTVEAYKRFMSS